MLRKKAKGSQVLQKCSNCGKSVKILYEKYGKKICGDCFNKE